MSRLPWAWTIGLKRGPLCLHGAVTLCVGVGSMGCVHVGRGRFPALRGGGRRLVLRGRTWMGLEEADVNLGSTLRL
jgi:hypothetical protein